ncbi:protein S100-A5-like [Hippocampus comes]|uniref:protein S100-A5-like n=1 Tax=Hippocampus comes TaxID=109280 RepID=UPI00094E95EF|nr:PREDICTED: protein S100-A5-like [Hippocampus comes]
MAKIHQSIQAVLDFFDQYKGEDGVLDKKEFRAIIEKECKGNVDESVLEKLFEKLDQNKDGKLDMEEYSAVICLMIRASYYRRKQCGFGGRCTGKGSSK